MNRGFLWKQTPNKLMFSRHCNAQTLQRRLDIWGQVQQVGTGEWGPPVSHLDLWHGWSKESRWGLQHCINSGFSLPVSVLLGEISSCFGRFFPNTFKLQIIPIPLPNSRDDQLRATGLVLSGELPTATPLLAKARAGDLDPKLQVISFARGWNPPYLPAMDFLSD